MDHAFSLNSYMPHGQCYLWQTNLLLLHVISDALIVLSYYSIPFALLYVLKKRTDIQFSWIYTMFGIFIFMCGTTHAMSIWTVWIPDYWLAGGIKFLTALSSLATAILIWPLIPKILAIPSQAQLLALNTQLEEEIENHKETEYQLRKLSLAVQNSSSIVLITDAEAIIEYCNPAFYQVTGFSEPEVLGHKANLLKSDLTDKAVYKELWAKIQAGLNWNGEFLNRKKNGELFWCLESIAPMLDENGTITNYVSIIHDISDRKQSEELMKRLAYFDPLTNLPNRILFNQRLEHAINRSKRSQLAFAVMYLDLDRFKNVNDTLGHLVGDKLLIEVGKRITDSMREDETIVRLGGDEFAVITQELRTPTDAGDIAQRIVNNIIKPFNLDDHELFISTSLGISIYPDDATDSEQLIKHADDALYFAKQRGRNKFEFYNDETNALSIRRLLLEKHLHSALELNEFSLVYQPKINLKNHEIIGAEVLLRWFPEIGEVHPEEFIPVAEDTGLIIAMGQWVLKTACMDLVQFGFQQKHSFQLAINLSARQFRQADLLESMDAILSATGLLPNQLEIEITESTLMEDPEHAIEQMQGLKARGIALAIDDFGTGYSSLSYLKRFSVNSLKIDKSFVKDIGSNHDDSCIVSSVIALAHSLNLKVTAEGVESADQLEILKKRNCDEAQGFFFHRPMPIADFCKLF